ncbi:HK97 family phage prohead protease [Paenibacillus tyrfis]|uniref:HK97 family phage prohead protease n=1 Tax=Paenibacillus tyrfis TaxID=1501230 RepID=UPI001F27D9D7|nr:HK97 family phage prohead protease [Paenibacillus tyrfis]
MHKETRYLKAEQLEVRSGAEGEETRTVTGYVVRFNQRSSLIWGEFYEKVAKGAFARSLQENTIKALWDHKSNFVLGSTKNQTLRLWEDTIGLRFELDLPNNTWGNDAYESIRRGDVDGVSFGFNVRKDAWTFLSEDDVYERTLVDVNLFEVSPTPFPAYPDSEVNQRSIEAMPIESREQRRLKKEKLLFELDLLAI